MCLPFSNANGCLSSVKLLQVGGGRGGGMDSIALVEISKPE